MKCAICGKKIEETFLKKLVGTYMRKNSKRYAVCGNCQKSLSKEQLLEKL